MVWKVPMTSAIGKPLVPSSTGIPFMFRHRHMEPLRGSREMAFTLIEIVVALTIIAIIAAVAIPTLKGIGREERARAPIAALASLVQEVRARALRERKPYQIVFEKTGLHGLADGFPTANREDFLKALDTDRTPPPDPEFEQTTPEIADVVTAPATVGNQTTPPPATTTTSPPPRRWEPPWSVSITLEDRAECEILLWGDGEWDLLEGEDLRRWVFQPSGLASPISVRMRTRTVEIEATFDALTGEMVRERIDFLDQKP